MEKLQIENIPEELTKLPHWVAWKAADRGNGKISKLPVNPMTGKYAKTNDPTTWGEYETAVAHCQNNGLQGIGYVFSKDDPFIGIDLDDCLNGVFS
jgi:putative DNA primase/helicase